jgi:hypothetical protein
MGLEVAGPCGGQRGVVGPRGVGRVHEENFNLNLNMSLNSGKI